MEQSVLLRVWTRIVSELAVHQDLAPQEFSGQVVNSICGTPYILDTACAVKVFAVEYHRTQNKQWLTRAMSGFESISIQNLYSGIPEPIWDSIGWHEQPGSLAATGMAIDALWDSMDLLGLSHQENHFDSLLCFLNRCFHGNGRFAHNTLKQGKRPSDVQNTNAVALYLSERISKITKTEHPLLKERNQTLRHLCGGQDRSGYWSYLYPGRRRQLVILLPFLARIGQIRRFFPNTQFGDTLHQVVTLYFLMKYASASNNNNCYEAISRGWDWINRHLIYNKGKLEMDWSWEPIPTCPRYCNSRDTNTYFWILGLLPNLEKQEIVNRDKSAKMVSGLLMHIDNNLLEEDGKFPCIVPHEGPPEILRNILPMFDQGVAWKGCFLAEIIRQKL